MKLKYILIVSLILTIITLGAVSASEDIASDDELTVIDEVDESVVEADDSNDDINTIAEDNEEIIAGDEDLNNDKLSYDDEDEIYYHVYDVSLDDDEDYMVSFSSYDPTIEGTLKVFVNNALKKQLTFDYEDYNEDDELYVRYWASDLGIYNAGDYTVKLTLDDDLLCEETVHVSEYSFGLYAELYEDDGSQTYFEFGDTIIFKVYLPDDATNRLTLNVNGKTYDVTYKNGIGKVSVSTAGWNLGSYKVTASYAGNNKYSPDSRSETIYIEPKIDYPSYMSVGEQEYITITAPSGNGNMIITGYKWDNYEDEYVKFTVQNVNIVNGRGSYSLSNLAAHDDYKFNINYYIGSYGDDINAHVVVKQNSPGFASSVTPTEIIVGNNVNVQVSGPKLNSMVDIFVDDKLSKSVSLYNGPINEVLTGLSVGTHKININFDDGEYFYSNTVYVTVKPVPAPPSKAVAKKTLTLKKVAVKKSAKKLVLTATLKQGKTPLKNKKITFKFNGKKYTAKTNKKGIAKVTIKKSILKKLKVGKKVKYQASYAKLIKKVTVKVKK